MSHLFLSEPPLRFGADEPPEDLAVRLQALVDEGRGEEAVLTFMRENVRLPEAAIAGFRASPGLAPAAAIAQTTVYDTALVAAVSTPTPTMLGVEMPVTILRGDPADPMIVAATDRLSAEMFAELVVVPESKNHGVDPTGTVREILARIG